MSRPCTATSASTRTGRSGARTTTMQHLIRDAARVVGLYDDGRQIGFCRVASDDTTYAWLFDVYVLPEYRGRGLGVELVREAVENGPHAHLRWILHTQGHAPVCTRASASRLPASAAWSGPQAADRLARRCANAHSFFPERISRRHARCRRRIRSASPRRGVSISVGVFSTRQRACSATTRPRSRPSGRRSGTTPRPSSLRTPSRGRTPRACSTCSRCCRTPPAICTWGTSRTTRSAMRSAISAAATACACCTRWATTRSACRPRTPRSARAATRATSRTTTSPRSASR